MDRDWAAKMAEWRAHRQAKRERTVVSNSQASVGFLLDELSQKLASGVISRSTPILSMNGGIINGLCIEPNFEDHPAVVVLVREH